jgi:DNA-directed RNA polymerase subunit L
LSNERWLKVIGDTLHTIYNEESEGRSGKLQVQTTTEDEKGLTVEITGEDYSLAEIVHHELLEEKSVTFAGVLPPHPLIKKLVLKVRAQRIKPEKAFSNSVERAMETTQELLDGVKKALGGGSA